MRGGSASNLAHDSFGRCPDCGKIRWATRKVAKRRMRGFDHRAGRLHVYRCGDFWHIGHMPAGVTRGELARDQLSPRPGGGGS